MRGGLIAGSTLVAVVACRDGAAEQQMTAAHTIQESVASVSDGARRAAESTVQLDSAVHDLARLADDLDQVVKLFKVAS